MIWFRRFPLFLAGAFFILSVTCCAPVPTDPDDRADYEHNHDPAEPVNRKIFAANMAVDHYVLQPVARAYKSDLPEHVQLVGHNFATNLQEPQIALNDALQGNMGRSGHSAFRFAINSTLGLGGLFDVAGGWGVVHHDSDFGQTFGVWGIGSGPFVELPLLGSSNVRDGVGTAVGIITNPFGSFLAPVPLTTIGYVGSGIGVVDGRAEVLKATDQLERNSLDYYATLRSISWQQRAKLIADGKNPDAEKAKNGQSEPKSPAPFVPFFRSSPYF